MVGATLTVKQLNTYVKSLVESDLRLSDISLCGEISNFKNHYSSGHWYFTLKDRDAQIRCVMFAGFANRVTFDVQDGISVILKGRVSIYERDGQYQFYAEEMSQNGEGDLALAFNRLKERLEKEGLFDLERKRPLKRYPEKIAVLTSDTGAAVRDILNILGKRYPLCRILLCPVAVQGVSAAGGIINMLDSVYQRDDIDTIIVGRGGGSLEDLWVFNDENLARKIYESPVPVISAVGHETDFTICDFVADVRASTPSHAAELAVPDMNALSGLILSYKNKIGNLLSSKYELAFARYKLAVSGRYFSSPATYFENFYIKTDILYDRIKSSFDNKMSECEQRFSSLMLRIDALSPIKTISRGYAAVSSGGRKIVSVAELSVNEDIDLRFSDGVVECRVREIKE